MINNDDDCGDDDHGEDESVSDDVDGGDDNEEDISDAGSKLGSTTQPTADDDDCKESLLRFILVLFYVVTFNMICLN